MIARLGVGIAVVAAILLVATLALAPSLAPVNNPQIAFETYRDGNGEIYLLDAASGILYNLTQHGKTDARPAWSPDGTQIAFFSNRSDNYEVYVMDADGGNVRNLTRHASDDFAPTWSPDGTQIAFVSRRDGNNEIYIMEIPRHDPACDELLESTLLGEDHECAPHVRRLTNSLAEETSPVWSPDGRRIAFSLETDLDSEIYTMSVFCASPHGCRSDRYNLSDNPARDRDPAWSPDGRYIAFTSNRGGTWDIYVMSADGSRTQQLTDGMGAYVNPAWSPDGTQLVLAARYAGIWSLYTMDMTCGSLLDICGSNLRALTYNVTEDFRPVWQP